MNIFLINLSFSSKSLFDNKKAIRGGIPVVFRKEIFKLYVNLWKIFLINLYNGVNIAHFKYIGIQPD